MSDRHRVVVVGAGFGGLNATKALKQRADVQVTLINGTTHHLFQPLLYQVATGILSEGEIAVPVREILKRQDNAEVLIGHVTGVDVENRMVTASAPGGTSYQVGYDTLILAAGASQSYFGNDHFAQHAPGMKTVDDALELRGRIFGAFEMAELETDPEAVERQLTFVVVGGGPTGVEMAGQIAELAHRTLPGQFRRIDPRQAKVILVDAVDAVLPTFGPKLSGKAREQLEKVGVTVQLGAKVVGVDADGITVETSEGREHIASATKIWAAGVAAPAIARQVAEAAGAEVDRAGRILVNPDCTVPGHPEIFVVGDTMSLDRLPGVAQVAIQSGAYAGRTITARLDGKPEPAPFKYRDKGSMATISRFAAIASVGGMRLSGFVAWMMWLLVHLMFLVGFKNRASAVGHWIGSFVGRGRSERVTTTQQVLAREAIQYLESARSSGELLATSGKE